MGDRRNSEQDLAERVLSGRLDPADAPPELAPVAALVRRAAEVPASAAIDDALVAAMATAVAESAAPHTTTRRSRRPVLAQLLTAKVAAAALTATLGATGAAAATGSLPDPVQDKVAGVAEHVGVNLPESASQRAKDVHKILAETDPGRERGARLSQKPEGAGPEDKVTGQERATQAKAEAQARRAAAQQKAAEAKAKGQAESQGDAGTQDERQSPPVSTPNKGGTDTADDAEEDDASQTGTTRAAEKSGGASVKGSGNAEQE